MALVVIVRMVGETEVDKSVRVLLIREGGTQTVLVTLGRREEAEGTATGPEPQELQELEILGMTLLGLTPEMREDLGLESSERGVAVTVVDETSEAFDKGIRPGDIIAEIGQQPVQTPQDVSDRFDAAKEAGRRSILMLVRREGQPRFVALSPGN